MSQPNVERVVGLLATDEAFRLRFAKDPRAAIQQLVETGMVLTHCEERALAALDLRELARFAASIDPRLQKIDLKGCSDASGPDRRE
jgi:hypothetical protein